MPLTVSVSALAWRLFGASHWWPYQRANQIARLRLGDLERQQRLRTKRILDLLVRHERRRAAEVAAAADLFGVEDRNRLAALAADRGLLACQPRAESGMPRERRGEIVLDDDGVGAARLQRRRRLGAAERTDERLLGRIPVRLGAARGTVELLAGGGDLFGRTPGSGGCGQSRSRVDATSRNRRPLRLRSHVRDSRATSGNRRARSS